MINKKNFSSERNLFSNEKTNGSSVLPAFRWRDAYVLKHRRNAGTSTIWREKFPAFSMRHCFPQVGQLDTSVDKKST